MALILRQDKGSKLTIAEMDANLTYLESLAGLTSSQGATGSDTSSLLPTTGEGTATGNISGNLDGHNLLIGSNGTYLNITPLDKYISIYTRGGDDSYSIDGNTHTHRWYSNDNHNIQFDPSSFTINGGRFIMNGDNSVSALFMNGFVGIGTDEPSVALDVVGDSHLTGSLYFGTGGQNISRGSFDNETGGDQGISLNCAVGYELNWQGGQLEVKQGENRVPLVISSDLTVLSDEVSFRIGICQIGNENNRYANFRGGEVVIGDVDNSIAGDKLYINTNDSFCYYDNNSHTGKFGINTTEPSVALDVVGQVKILDGNQSDGYVFTCDSDGLGSWQASSAGGLMGITQEGVSGKLQNSDGYWTLTETGGASFTQAQASKFFNNGPDGEMAIVNDVIGMYQSIPTMIFKVENTDRLYLDNTGKLSNNNWYINADGTNNLGGGGGPIIGYATDESTTITTITNVDDIVYIDGSGNSAGEIINISSGPYDGKRVQIICTTTGGNVLFNNSGNIKFPSGVSSPITLSANNFDFIEVQWNVNENKWFVIDVKHY